MALRGGLSSPPGFGTNVVAVPPVTGMAGTDTLVINAAGTGPTEQIQASSALTALGKTIPQLGVANPASDADAFATNQGGTVSAQQSLAAIWTWIATQKYPVLLLPTMDVSGPLTLDFSTHNHRTLRAIGALTVSAPSSFLSLGDGFECSILSVNQTVTFSLTNGIGMTTSTGQTGMSSGVASVRALNGGGGGAQLVYVNLPGSAVGAGPSISVETIAPQQPSTTFTVIADLSGYGGTVPSLSYKIDTGSPVSIPGGDLVGSKATFPVTGGVTAGSHTITVLDGNGVSGTSNGFSASSSPALALNAPGSVPLANNVVLTGTASNYGGSPPTAFDVSLDNGATWPVTNISNTGAGTSITATVTAGTISAGSYTQTKIRDHNSTSVVSNAATLNVETASTSGTATTGTAGSALSPLGSFTLTGLASGWQALFDVTASAQEGSRQNIVGASGALLSVTPALAHTYRQEIWDASSGGNKLVQAANAVVSGATPTVIVSVTPSGIGNVSSALIFAFTYTGGDPASVLVGINGGSASSVGVTSASGGNGTFSITPGAAGVNTIAVQDAGAGATVTQRFYSQPAVETPTRWQWGGTYETAPPNNPAPHNVGDNVKPILTVNTGTADTPKTTTANLWFCGWSASPNVPPTGTGWASGIPTANLPAGAGSNWTTLTFSGSFATSGFVSFTQNAPSTLGFAAGNTVYAWLVAPSGYAFSVPTGIVLT